MPLFSELGRKDLKRLLEAMSKRSFPAGTRMATEGDVGVGFFVIVDGRATVSIGGREVGELGPGDHFGELSLIAEQPRTATVTAVTDVSCYRMTSWDFRRLAEENAAFSWRVLEATARNLISAQGP